MLRLVVLQNSTGVCRINTRPKRCYLHYDAVLRVILTDCSCVRIGMCTWRVLSQAYSLDPAPRYFKARLSENQRPPSRPTQRARRLPNRLALARVGPRKGRSPASGRGSGRTGFSQKGRKSCMFWNMLLQVRMCRHILSHICHML